MHLLCLAYWAVPSVSELLSEFSWDSMAFAILASNSLVVFRVSMSLSLNMVFEDLVIGYFFLMILY